MHLPGAEENNSNMTGIVAAQEPDFSEFMWMAEEDLESFDNKVLQEVHVRVQQHILHDASQSRAEEEAFLQQMLDEEEARDTVYYQPNSGQANLQAAMHNQMQRLQIAQMQQRQQIISQNSILHQQQMQQQLQQQPLAPSDFQLNPEAAVFVPRTSPETYAANEVIITEQPGAAPSPHTA